MMILSQVLIFPLNEPICLSFIYFNLVFAVGCLLGPLRVLLLEPKVGARKAELLELLLMTRIIWKCAQFVGRRNALQNQTEQKKPCYSQRWELAATGLMALLWLLAAEMVAAAYSRGGGGGLRKYFQERDPVAGPAYVIVVPFYAVMLWHVLEAYVPCDSKATPEELWNQAMWGEVERVV